MKFQNIKVMSYTYRGVHKQTKQVYIGYRSANKVPSSEDFGKKYFTSSKYVKKMGFENFDWEITSHIFEKKIANEVENEMIQEQWRIDKSLSLNYHMHRKWNTIGIDVWSNLSDEAKAESNAKKSLALKGVPKSDKHKANMALAQQNMSDEAKANMSLAKRGIPRAPFSDEHKAKMSLAKRGIPQGPFSDEHKAKLSIVHQNRSDKAKAEISAKMSLAKKGIALIRYSCIICKKEMPINHLNRHQNGKNCCL